VPLAKGMIQDDCYALNPQYATPSSPAKDTILIPSVSKSCISSMVEVGQGYFGKVYKGNRPGRESFRRAYRATTV